MERDEGMACRLGDKRVLPLGYRIEAVAVVEEGCWIVAAGDAIRRVGRKSELRTAVPHPGKEADSAQKP